MDHLTRIQNNLAQVTEKIQTAAHRAGRNPDKVKLVVVSKGQPLEVIQAAIAAGVRIFGENYPEETAAKIQAAANDNVEWHMIGHLQSRKARLVCDHFQYMHSLESLHDYLRRSFPDQTWDELSMGTSSDFEAAIQEGATFVRIGTSILGPRPNKV